jgi:hypothetical protein
MNGSQVSFQVGLWAVHGKKITINAESSPMIKDIQNMVRLTMKSYLTIMGDMVWPERSQ